MKTPRGSLRLIAEQAGKNGVIARQGWAEGRVLLVRLARMEGANLRLMAIESTNDSIGNFDPDSNDLRAIDWYVVAQSNMKHEV